MYITRHRVDLAVTASGGASQAFYSPYISGGGFIEAVQYAPGTASGISTAGHLTITAEYSGLTILTCTATGIVTHYPHAKAEDTSGAVLGYTSAATPPGIPCKIPVAHERIKIEVTSGGTCSGSPRTGAVDLYISGV